MIFLQDIYQLLENMLAPHINHFPLIKLVFHAVDQTILFYGIFLIARLLYVVVRKKMHHVQIDKKREVYVHLFFVYMVLLYHLTVFRNGMTVFQARIEWHALSDIYILPFVDSVKLFFGESLFSPLYNIVGNIVWFIPLGFLSSRLIGTKQTGLRSIVLGGIISLSIESMQFLFYIGVAHIDDVLLNILGSWIGYRLYGLYQQYKGGRANN